MKKGILYILLSLMCFAVNAQDLTSIFLKAPDSVLFGLDAENKDKLINTTTDSITATATSVLGGNVVRKAISEDYILLKTSSAGTLQIKMLPLVNNSKIICIAKTVCGKACDSTLEFYTTEWDALPKTSLFPEIDIKWFIKDGIDKNSDDFTNAFAAITMLPIKIVLDSSNFNATVTLDIENYLSKDDLDKVKPFLNDSPKVLTWDKISFK